MSRNGPQLELLKSAARGLVTIARSNDARPCELEDAAAALEERGIVGLTLDFRERSAKGFSREAARDVVQLTRSLRQSRGDFAWGVSLNAMCDAVAKTVMEMFRTRSADEANAEDLARLKRTVEAQFAEAVVTRRHLVPCTILPGSARSIEFGPVRFLHQSALDPNDYGLAAIKGGAKAYLGPLSRMMARHEASWLAEVSVGGCEGHRHCFAGIRCTSISLACGLVTGWRPTQRWSSLNAAAANTALYHRSEPRAVWGGGSREILKFEAPIDRSEIVPAARRRPPKACAPRRCTSRGTCSGRPRRKSEFAR